MRNTLHKGGCRLSRRKIAFARLLLIASSSSFFVLLLLRLLLFIFFFFPFFLSSFWLYEKELHGQLTVYKLLNKWWEKRRASVCLCSRTPAKLRRKRDALILAIRLCNHTFYSAAVLCYVYPQARSRESTAQRDAEGAGGGNYM